MPYFFSSLHYFSFPKYQTSRDHLVWLVRPALLKNSSTSSFMCPPVPLPPTTTLPRHRLLSTKTTSRRVACLSRRALLPKTSFPLLDVRRSSRPFANYDYDSNTTFKISKRRQKFDMVRSSSTSSKIRLQRYHDWFSSCLSSTTWIVQNTDGKFSWCVRWALLRKVPGNVNMTGVLLAFRRILEVFEKED